MIKVHIDFETRSELSVKDVGASKYASHPSTEIMSLAFKVNDEQTEHLDEFELRETKNTTRQRLIKLAQDKDVVFVAHNALFEQNVWWFILVKRHGWPDIALRRWRCTAAKAAAFALPRDLFRASKALGLSIQKDEDGHRIMLKLSRKRRPSKKNPDKFWTPHTAPEDFERMYEYNITDVEVEKMVDDTVRDLSAFEQEIWFLDQEINFRGVQVDLDGVYRAIHLLEEHKETLLEEFRTLTGGVVETPGQLEKFLKWLKSRGIELPNLQAATVDKLLENPPAGKRTALRTLEIRRSLAKASTKKYQAFATRCTDKGRLTDILMYHAASTGRWGGKGVQLQNLLRPVVDGETVLDLAMLCSYEEMCMFYGDIMAAFGSAVRSVIWAKAKHELMAADFSAIEARVLSWCAGQQWKLDLFAAGQDLYCKAATGIFGYDVVKKEHPDERQIGKVSELALGYEGGIGAFGTMAKGYGLKIRPIYDLLWHTATEDEEERAQRAYAVYMSRKPDDPLSREEAYISDLIKQRWRRTNPEVPRFWRDVNEAAIRAVQTGQKVTVGGYHPEQPTILWAKAGDFLHCKLPSGRLLAYHKPKILMKETPWGEEKATLSYMGVNSMTNQYIRLMAYGGLLTENIVQAISRDLMAEAMLRVRDAGYKIVLSVHDELVSENPIGFGSVKEFENLMAQLPPWAAGLPVKAEGWKGKRYRK